MRSQKAVKNIITSLLQQVVTVICGLIVPRAIIGSFGSSVNGLISSITQFLSYITLLEAGIGPVIKSTLYKPIAKKDKTQIEKILKASQRFFRVISGIFIIYLIALCFIYPLIVSTEFETGYTISLILIIAISTFAEYFFGMVYKLYLQAEQKTYVTSTIQILTTIVNAILVILLIKFGANIQVVKLGSAFIFVFRPILQNIYVKKKYNINFKDVKEKYELKQKWDGLAQHIASVVHNSTDIAILTIFTTTVEVSVYSVYLYVINGVKNMVQALTGGVDASFGDMIAKNEIDNLNRSFRTYELFYFTLITIVYIITLVTILPFIKVYTLGITDANYYRPTFAIFITLAELMWSIRLPYSSVTLAAGHFKQTNKGAWIEVFTNLIISILLVFKLGMIGVAIGTLVAMTIRTIEFMYHTSKYILKRKQIENIKRVIILATEMLVIVPIGFFISSFINVNSYISWLVLAVIIGIISLLGVGITNSIIYRKDLKDLLNMIKRLKQRKVTYNDN